MDEILAKRIERGCVLQIFCINKIIRNKERAVIKRLSQRALVSWSMLFGDLNLDQTMFFIECLFLGGMNGGHIYRGWNTEMIGCLRDYAKKPKFPSPAGYNKCIDNPSLSDHHLLPRTRGGSELENNKVQLPWEFHKFWHMLFGLLTPEEAIIYIQKIFAARSRNHDWDNSRLHELQIDIQKKTIIEFRRGKGNLRTATILCMAA